MRGCARNPKAAWVIMLFTALNLAACSDPEADSRFVLQQVNAHWTNGRLNVISEQKLVLSDEARDALTHGVPLSLAWELRLRNVNSQTRVVEESRHYEIRYLPLSDHFQLAYSDETSVKTFPRLRHVLAELSTLNLSITTGVLPAGEYELLVRMRLDQGRMPPPMRLPVLLSSKWRHDSSWSSWPLMIEPET